MTGVFAVAILLAMAVSPLIIDLALTSLRRRMRRRSWVGVPVADVDEPIQAVKRARVRAAPDGSAATLSGLTFGGRYTAEDHARCPRGCRAPEDGCDCGFYAVRPDTEDVVLGGLQRGQGNISSVRLDVELSGEVLEYELGYRAERQRVLRVLVSRRCAACLRHDAERLAVAMSPAPRVLWDPRGRVDVRFGCNDEWPVLEPACELHLPDPTRPKREPSGAVGIIGVAAIGLPDLAGLLGTEVGWAPVEGAGQLTDTA